MFINKMGKYHAEYGINNQDWGFLFERHTACVTDGCSESAHSEVGVKLFTKKLREKISVKQSGLNEQDIRDTFLDVKNFIINQSDHNNYLQDMLNYMCFTILVVQELYDCWLVFVYGDGVIITETKDGLVDFVTIQSGDTPPYLCYEYIPPEMIDCQNITLGFQTFIYGKDAYKSVGIATDGLSKIIGTEHENLFKELIKNRKEWTIRRKINQLRIFSDDTTIALAY